MTDTNKKYRIVSEVESFISHEDLKALWEERSDLPFTEDIAERFSDYLSGCISGAIDLYWRGWCSEGVSDIEEELSP